MQRRQQKVKCEDTFRVGKEQIKRLIAASAGMVVESATGITFHFVLPHFTGKAS